MRLLALTAILVIVTTRLLSAQVTAPLDGWRLGVGVDAVRFAHVGLSDALPGQDTEVRPTSRPAAWVSVGRGAGPWRVALEAGWAGGHLEASNDEVLVQDLVSEVSRYRLALDIGRRIAAVGQGVLELDVAPTVDMWRVAGEGRVRAGAELRAVLRLPLGGAELSNRIGLGFSGNPILREDLGEASELRGLRAFLVGIGLAIPI